MGYVVKAATRAHGSHKEKPTLSGRLAALNSTLFSFGLEPEPASPDDRAHEAAQR